MMYKMKLAIDIALLPPEEIMDKAIEINKKLVDDPTILNKENCLPHITLCMGVLKEEDLPKVKEILQEISDNYSKLSLKISRINEEHSAFDIEKTEELQKLHETIVNQLAPILTYDATTEICFSPPPVVERTLFWINNYKENSSFEKFYPHITLGVQKIEGKELSVPFQASRLVLCHLGNYCTCRKILFETELK